MNYEARTKAELMKILDDRGVDYRKKDTKPVLIQLCEQSKKKVWAEAPKAAEVEYTNEETVARATDLSSKLRNLAQAMRSDREGAIEAAKAEMIAKLQQASSRVSSEEIKKHWDGQIPPQKAREKAIKQAKRAKKSKRAKESRRANR